MDDVETPRGGSPILNRIMLEYNEGQDTLRTKKLNWVQNLVLFNNLQRDDQTIASTLLFSYFNRVLSNLYSDVLQATFVPSEDSDYKKTEACNKLYQNDYQEMEMGKLNYDWIWDACFFGEGYMETLVFNKKKKIMEPHVLNPLYVGHDPFFEEPKQWRYWNAWMTFSRNDLEKLKLKKVLSQDIDLNRISPGLETELWDYKNRRDSARLGTNVTASSSSSNDVYQILKHYTFVMEQDGPIYTSDLKLVKPGERVIVWTDKNFSQQLRLERLSKYVPDDEPWPVVRKQIFKEPHSSMSISVPDIVQDKHRAQSVLLNLMYISAKDEANPIYLYDPDHVQDVTAFLSRQISQHIPVDDMQKSVQPMNTKSAVNPSVSAFMQMLAGMSSEAIGTAIVQPSVQKGKKSATESAMSQQVADLASSLQAKIIAQGEQEFVSHWYARLANNMKQGDEKIITLTSVTGVTFENIKADDFKTKFPPKIMVRSKKEAEYKELVLRRDLMQNYPILVKSMDPRALNNFNKYVYFPKFIDDSATIDRIVPSTIDQIKQRQENEMLDQGIFVPVDPLDNDEEHLYECMMAKHTPAMWAHYFIHEKHAAIKKKQAEDKAAQDEQGKGGGDTSPIAGGQGGMGKNLQKNAPNQNKIPQQVDKQNPMKAAVPLAKETANNIQQKGRPLA